METTKIKSLPRRKGRLVKIVLLIISLIFFIYGLKNKIVDTLKIVQKKNSNKNGINPSEVKQSQENPNSHLSISCGGFLE
jgi:hypothetical protein